MISITTANDLLKLKFKYFEKMNPEGELIEFFGGDVFVITNEKDLKSISTLSGRPITEQHTVFDSVEEEDDYFFFFLATNNAGGPTWVVPKRFVEKYNTIKESIEATRLVWSSS